MGRSPVVMRQVTDKESSTLAGSSPKLKGVILGGALWKGRVWRNNIQETKKELLFICREIFLTVHN